MQGVGLLLVLSAPASCRSAVATQRRSQQPPAWSEVRARPSWRRQSSAELSQIWDPQTLASFSLSQLGALADIFSGYCPWLSRAIRCRAHGGQTSAKGLAKLRVLGALYLEEEAVLAQRQAISMMRHVWQNYEQYAFAKDLLRPVSGTGTDSWGGIGQTLVDALDTLWLMGFREEFDRAATWVEQSLSFAKDLNVNLFETTIRHLGGLLSAFALSGRRGLLAKAVDLGDRLIQAFPAFPPDALAASRAAAAGGPGSPGMEALKAVAKKGAKWSADFRKLLQQVGLPQDALDSVLGNEDNKEDVSVASLLPSSDVNLNTGEAKNLAGFVSLAEAYVPMEWKYLAALTGNCTYSGAQDRVLQVINRSLDLEKRGLAAILLKTDGTALASPQNRISLGSRGDSFYEYLLKDTLFSGEFADPLAQILWNSFRSKLPELLVEADSKAAAKARQSFRRARKRNPETAEVSRGLGGSLGGWHESWRDVSTPWLFLKEVTISQTVPKMDHLMCFLPGAIALEVFHDRSTRKREVDLKLAHKLAETCVHMYWRTVSDLAPEITRFNALGLVDDLGSMHNILRPETIESLFLLWRTTKRQIYRNWGQRMLSAFYRMKTSFGFASLHNVNQPSKLRDDMPSFFVAETLKYLFLLFSDDKVLPLDQFVLSTEAHPVPMLHTLGGSAWPCRTDAQLLMETDVVKSVVQAHTNVPELKQVHAMEPPAQPAAAQVPQKDCDRDRLQHLKLKIQELQGQLREERASCGEEAGDPSCWVGGFSFKDCCFPPAGNPGCWDVEFTYARCCR